MPVERLAEEILWPMAAEVDAASSIPAGHFEALAELGLYSMAVSAERGGMGLPAAGIRSVLRVLGGACGATAFAFAQHHGTIGAVASTDNQALQDRWLQPLSDRTLAGIAYAHVRRPGTPVLAATETDDGWVLDGTAPWVTSWGTAKAFGVAAATADGRIVWSLLPMGTNGGLPPGVRPGKAFDLMVFGATQTVAVHFERHLIEPDLLLSVVDGETWAARDRLLAARPNPLCIGVGDRALQQLSVLAPDLASDLEPAWSAIVDRAEAQCRLVDEGSAELEQVAAMRAEVLVAVQRLTTALLSAVGGGAMERTHPAQRLAREAQFYVVQAQNGDGRRAVFANLAASGL